MSVEKDVSSILKNHPGIKTGLSQLEVSKLQAKYGFNEVEKNKLSWWGMIKPHVWGPIPWLIEIAIILSFIIKDKQDLIIITVLFFVNLVIGFWQAYRADRSINTLQKEISQVVLVRRDNNWQRISARELVVGDIVRVRLGDIVAADCLLISGTNLNVDQSTLTGESLPVEKKVGESVYSGTIVTVGEADAVVTAIGINSEYGKTTKLASAEMPQSDFEKSITAISRYLIFFAFVLISVIFIFGVWRHESLIETLTFALVLVVAAIPAALPTVLSVTMAIGSLVMAKHKAIVRTTTAIEELAGMNVFCTDKTGTLTENRLTITEIKTFGSWSTADALAMAGTAVKAENTEAIQHVVWQTLETNFEAKKKFASYVVTDYQPFNPDDKYSKAEIKSTNNLITVVLGAVPAVLEKCQASVEQVREVTKVVDDYASKGYRTLLVASCLQGEKDIKLATLEISDVLRHDTISTLQAIKDLGVRIIMITGDHITVAKQVAKQIGIGTKIKLGKVISFNHEIPTDVSGYAEVLPKDKYDLVSNLQATGVIVGMTGDGVNDAPALRRANAGIAVRGATDAARDASDIVFTASGLSPVVAAISVSRQIFARMQSYALYRIAETIRILLFVTLSVVIFQIYPLTATMIVLLAILNDAAIISVAYDNAAVAKTPQRFQVKRLVGNALFLGVVGVISSFFLLYLAYIVFTVSLPVLQTIIYLKLSVAGHLLIFSTRTRKWFFQDRPSFILLGAVFATQIIATMIAVFGIFLTPISLMTAGLIWGYVLIAFTLTDGAKVLYFKMQDAKAIKKEITKESVI